MGLDFVELTMRVEDSFGVRVEPDDFRRATAAPGARLEVHTTAGDLLEVVLRKRILLVRDADDGGLRELAVADVRRALADVLALPVDAIGPQDSLESLVNKRRRRGIWRQLARRLRKRLPRLECDVVSERAVWWISCLMFTAAAATAGIWWASSEPMSPVQLVLSVVMVSACAVMPGVMAAAVLVSLPWWLRRKLPPHAATAADLGVAVLGLNRKRYVHEHGDRSDADVWPSLRVLIADVLDVPVERVTPDADLIRDLGMS